MSRTAQAIKVLRFIYVIFEREKITLMLHVDFHTPGSRTHEFGCIPANQTGRNEPRVFPSRNLLMGRAIDQLASLKADQPGHSVSTNSSQDGGVTTSPTVSSMSKFHHLVAGAGAGTLTAIITCPLDSKVKATHILSASITEAVFPVSTSH